MTELKIVRNFLGKNTRREDLAPNTKQVMTTYEVDLVISLIRYQSFNEESCRGMFRVKLHWLSVPKNDYFVC